MGELNFIPTLTNVHTQHETERGSETSVFKKRRKKYRTSFQNRESIIIATSITVINNQCLNGYKFHEKSFPVQSRGLISEVMASLAKLAN